MGVCVGEWMAEISGVCVWLLIECMCFSVCVSVCEGEGDVRSVTEAIPSENEKAERW